MGVGDQARDHVDHEVRDAVAAVLDLADVLKLVVDGLDQRPFAQQELVEQRHEPVGHVLVEPLLAEHDRPNDAQVRGNVNAEIDPWSSVLTTP